MKDKIVKIKCAYCGQEYHPKEIYLEEYFFGDPKYIHRDEAGKIDYFTGTPMDLEEEYVCDNCGRRMYIEADLSFKVSLEKNEEADVYSTKIKKKLFFNRGLFDDYDSGAKEQ